jgi:riboflavin kinase / FMN adenylyltransferase
MELIRGLHNLDVYRRKFPAQQCVLTIGNFDGVHCGHQMILRQLKEKSSLLGLPSTVLIFEPQPLEYFAGQGAPARLSAFREKVRLLAEAGVDSVICLQFTEAMRSQSASAFIEDILVNNLGVQHLIVGDDFRFGHKQSGDFQMLEKAGVHYGFGVSKTCTLMQNGERVSSTAVRTALMNSDFSRAEQLLARPYAISGRVMYGQQLGRTIGVPTANVALKGKKAPLEGVFAVEVAGLEAGKLVQGVANVGVRPTVCGKVPVLEVHLFDFDDSIYGQHIRVVFRKKIRNEQKFNGLDALQQQIHLDIASARKHFGAG